MALSTIPSSSSSSGTSPWLYDVFLSFRGEDTRNNFTSHLFSSLYRKGIRTFIDDDEIKRGDEISTKLLPAIEDSRISIIVLSNNYAWSRWCLDELVKTLECKKSKQQIVLPVFYHVDQSDVRHQRGSFGEALAKHAERLNGDRVKLQMWKDALQEVANLTGYQVIRNGRNESEFIQEIVQDVSRIVNDHSYLHVAEHPVGLKPHVEDVNLLLSVGTKDIRMIGIFGLGGIGKTTLAKAIYNSIAFRFEASCFLPIDSDTRNQANRLVQLQQTLLFESLGESLKVDNIDKGINMIKRRLHSKRVLLILDGVDHLDPLKKLAGARDWFGEGSRIIITTRDQNLLTAHDGVDSTYEMKGLNQDDAFQLFCWHAFRSEKPLDGYEEFVEQIINYAQSLPLALTVLGSDLYGRSKSEWMHALDQYRKIPHQDIQKILQTSYDRLRGSNHSLPMISTSEDRESSSVDLEKGASDTSTQNCCIYSVPKTLVEVIGKKWFEPLLVSIGHYNCKTDAKHKHLKVNQNNKQEFCRYLQSHAQKSMEELREIIRPEVEKIEFMSEKNDPAFLEMLVLDGCFILELFRILGKSKEIESNHPLASVGCTIPHEFYGDLLLLENQIPFVVLKKLYDTSKMLDEDYPLSLLALRFFNKGTISRSDKDLKKMSEHLNDSLHLLDLFRRSFITPDLDQPPKEKKTVVPVIHCITKLLKARIEIKLREAGDSFLAVKFKNGVIVMPKITPDDFMHSFLVNCRAFEQLDKESSKHITVYAYFLDCLVNTPRDVKYLYESNIIDSYAGMENMTKIAQLINKLGKEVDVNKIDTFYLYDLSVKVDRRYKNKWEKHLTVFKRRYCNTPWSWISVFAAVVLLLLTFLQTYYTMYAYYHPK